MANLANSARYKTVQTMLFCLSKKSLQSVFQMLYYASVMENIVLHFKKVTSDSDEQQQHFFLGTVEVPVLVIPLLVIVQFSLDCKRRIAFIFGGFYLTKFYL